MEYPHGGIIMAVIRSKKDKNYTVMSNTPLRDKNLGLKARGLLSTMLSLPDDWKYSISGLCSICKENETAIKSALKELERNNYLVIRKKKPSKTGSNRFEYEYDIYEEPKNENPKGEHDKVEVQPIENLGVESLGVENLCLENQPVENQPVENHALLNTDLLSTDLPNTDSPSKDEVSTDIPSTDSTNPQSINIPEEEYKESKYEGKEENSISINKDNCSDSSIEEKVCEVLDEIDEKGHAFPYGFDLKHKINSVEEVKKIATYFFQRHYAFFHENVFPEITWFNLYETAEEYCVTDGILYKESVYKFDQYKK